MKPTRRQYGAFGIGSLIGLGAVVSIGTSSTAAEISGEFTIPEIDTEIQSPVNRVSIDVNGTCRWDGGSPPSRVIIRLEAARDSTDYEQIAVKQLQDNLSATQKHTFSFTDVNLLDHSAISAVNFSPTQVGNTKSLTIHSRLTITVRHDGQQTAEAVLTESTPVEVTKTREGVVLTLGATGEIELNTSD